MPFHNTANLADYNFHIPSRSPACYCDGHFPGVQPGCEETSNGPIHGRAWVADDDWAGLFVLDQPAGDQAEDGGLGTRIADRIRVSGVLLDLRADAFFSRGQWREQAARLC